MFAGIISRDEGEPWGETGMTTEKWLTLPISRVRIGALIATQPGVLLHALTSPPAIPIGGDSVAHVIRWQGRMYLEDGHHRAVRAAIRGHEYLDARVLHLSGQGGLHLVERRLIRVHRSDPTRTRRHLPARVAQAG